MEVLMYNCPRCQNPFEKGTKYCPKCGCNLELEFIINPVCAKCGKHYSDGTKYCEADGSKLTTEEKLIPKCIRCGTVYPVGTKFCPIDGGAVIPEAFRNTQNTISNFSGSGSIYPKAPLGSRFGAYLLDGLFGFLLSIPSIFLIIGGISSATNYYSGRDAGLGLIILGILFSALPIIYGCIKDGLGEGQSWGKKIVGLMVINLDNNTPCTMGKSFLRALISGLIVAVPYLNLLTMWIEPIMVLATDDGRKAADKVANTQVIDIIHYKRSN
jgi:uncharacterized RDD family membrane protein YckC/RNA polymerase subunit RPABC4/transcription elongation factor Spt4